MAEEKHKIMDSSVLSSFVSSRPAKLPAGKLSAFVIAPSFTHEFRNFGAVPLLPLLLSDFAGSARDALSYLLRTAIEEGQLR